MLLDATVTGTDVALREIQLFGCHRDVDPGVATMGVSGDGNLTEEQKDE